MLDRDIRDILAGVFVSIVGLYFALAGAEYTFGTAARMGPGYMPVVLGWILAVLGVFIMIPAFFRRGERIVVHWDSLIASLLSLVAFAFALNILGVFFSTVIAVLIASVPKKLPLVKRFMIAVAIAVITSVIFVIGLARGGTASSPNWNPWWRATRPARALSPCRRVRRCAFRHPSTARQPQGLTVQTCLRRPMWPACPVTAMC